MNGLLTSLNGHILNGSGQQDTEVVDAMRQMMKAMILSPEIIRLIEPLVTLRVEAKIEKMFKSFKK